jgi:predicted RNA methylase
MRRVLWSTSVFAMLVSALPLAAQAPSPRYSNKLAPFVASPDRVIERMLEMAAIKPGETLIDLGCGDGRILITAVEKYKAKAIGVEISPKLVAQATDRIKREGLTQQAKVIQGDLLDTDLTNADVVTIYLESALNEQLKPRLANMLRAGARVVSHDYAISGWKPTKVDKSDGRHLVYLYEMPPSK